MSASSCFVNAMDSTVNKRVGENGNFEYEWSDDEKEMIVQFYFQCVRINKDDFVSVNNFMKRCNNILTNLKKTRKVPENKNDGLNLQNIPMKYFALQYFYKMIGHTRDIKTGKGERLLSYAQILVWYNHFPELAKFAFKTLVHNVNHDFSTDTSSKEQQYGSWCDVKYFCNFVKNTTHDYDHELIDYAIYLLSEQLKRDTINMRKNESVSLAARWAPKEKQTNSSWIYKKLAFIMFPYVDTAKSEDARQKATRKSYTSLRTQILSPLNKYLDTVEIKMTNSEGQWEKININSIPGKAHKKYQNAWKNMKKNGEVRYPENEDRVAFANKYIEHINKAVNGDKTAKVHGKTLNTYELVKDVFETSYSDKTTIDRINLQWKESGEKIMSNLGNVVAMADTSASMRDDNCLPFYNSLGLSIRISEKANPAFKNRVLSFSTNPHWFKFEEDDTFYDKVNSMKQHINCASTDFEKALKMILDAVIKSELTPEEVSNILLIVLSDMQINGFSSSEASSYGCYSAQNYDNTMYDRIKEMYSQAGMKSKYNTPFNPPHIVFWNLRKTEGFPTTSTQNNVTMISGYSDVLLNNLFENGTDSLKNYNPYSIVTHILDNRRYDCLSMYFRNYFYA